MSDNPRDEQFKGFAKLLGKELWEAGLIDLNHAEVYGAEELVIQIIAQRAYDLVKHTLATVKRDDIRYRAIDEVEDIPDMTAWTEEVQE